MNPNELDPETKANQALYDVETICTLCQCVEGTHVLFNPCPILDKNPICQDCCLVGCLRSTIAEKFSKVIGKELTIEQINEACKNCGRNYATQNEELANKLEKDSI